MTFKVDDSYDVIVVGAGPTGSMTAKHCAMRGLKTLVIEKRQEVGAPKRCGEGLGEAWMRIVGITPDRRWALQEMTGAVCWSPSGKRVQIDTANKGWVIERRIFDKQMAIDAVRAGARMITKSAVVDVLKEEDTVKGVIVETPDGTKEVMCKLLIAADGVDSMTAKYAGINTINPASEVDSGYQYEMFNIKMDDPHKIHLYFGTKIVPRGYIWIFPKGADCGNVGIGIGGHISEKTAKQYLDDWINAHPELFSEAGVVEVNGGCIPVGAPLEKPYGNGILIVGDAAHMVNAIHGGGMGTGMEAGIIAAEIAEKAIKKGDVSEKTLKEYADKWYEKRGNQLMQVLKVRKFFEQLGDEDMEKIADIVSPELLLEFADGKKFSAFLKVFAKSPRIALLAAKTLK